jgi:hypothetical protein
MVFRILLSKINKGSFGYSMFTYNHIEYDLDLNTPITALNLSTRSINALENAGIYTVNLLLTLNVEDLHGIKNLGIKSIKEIINCKKKLLADNFQKPIERDGYFTTINRPDCRYVLASETIFFSDPIGILDLSYNTFEVLWRSGIVTVKDVLKLDKHRLQNLRGFSAENIKEISICTEKIKSTIEITAGDIEGTKHFNVLLQNQIEQRLIRLQNEYQAIPIHRLKRILDLYVSSNKNDKIKNIRASMTNLFSSIKKIGDIEIKFKDIAMSSRTPELVSLFKFLSINIKTLMQKIFNLVYSTQNYERPFDILWKRAKGMTLQEIGDERSMSKERIRQLELKGLERLGLSIRNMPVDIIAFLSVDIDCGLVVKISELRKYFDDFEYAEPLIYLFRNEQISEAYMYRNDIDGFYKIGEEIDFKSYKIGKVEKEFKLAKKYIAVAAEIEDYLRGKGLSPSSLDDIYSKIPMVSIWIMQKILQKLNNIIEMKKGFIHRACIIDFDKTAELILEILKRQFNQFNGYTNSHILFEAAKIDILSFMKKNNLTDEWSIYAITKYLFSKEKYHNNCFVFAENLHIWEHDPHYPKNIDGILINLARKSGGKTTRKACESLLIKLKLSVNHIISFIHNTNDSTFYFYNEDVYVLSEYLVLDENYKNSIKIALDSLFIDKDYIIPRDIDKNWYYKLPQLTLELPWTLLLLQDVLRYNAELGYKPLFSNIEQSPYRIAPVFVKSSSIYTLTDIIYEYVKTTIGVPQKMTAEKLRRLLKKEGFIKHAEWFNNIHKALKDHRFVFSNRNKIVHIYG